LLFVVKKKKKKKRKAIKTVKSYTQEYYKLNGLAPTAGAITMCDLFILAGASGGFLPSSLLLRLS